MKAYDHKKIEKKWQNVWEVKKIYKTESVSKKKKMYVLDMFPYPSGMGLHVGHPRGYIGSDIYARMKRMEGFNVLHPMGYDAFGLPAEQYAIANKIHPRKAVEENVATFEKQLSIIGLSYDWSRRVNTTDPEYYKWTEWIFLQIYKSYFDKTKNKARPITELEKIFNKSGNKEVKAVCDNNTPVFTAKEWKNLSKIEKQNILMKYRLAYEGYAEVNWCPELGTVLANDEVVDGPNGTLLSERGGYPVEKKSMRQWFMRITAYADRLLTGLEGLDWSGHIKEIQRNWIGKSEGSEFEFKTTIDRNIKVFTTRIDTIFGVTYVVLSPEHSNIGEFLVQASNMAKVSQYIREVKEKAKNPSARGGQAQEKTGIELKGIKAINPANGEEVPVWVGDYVLADYGTGAVMAVPMHDERDRDFATKYNLPIVDKPLVDKKEITEFVGGKIVTKYKMRDAIFARQRYWGEPIPLIHKKDGIIETVPENKLPLELPNVKSYEPTGTGESPLASVKSWTDAGYETNTMPGWAGSSWYFLRYVDPKNKKELASKKSLDYWFGKKNGGVDMYVGGLEHATGHLLYSRFWHKFLYDIGIVKTEEPFRSLRNQGMIGGADGRKMSKRWGNVINPDDVVNTYGADTLRLYEAFMGPFDQGLPWSTESIIGPRRFIERVWNLQSNIDKNKKYSEFELEKTVKKVSEDIREMKFNTAVSAMMIVVNELSKLESISKIAYEKFLKILAPFAPHVAEEIYFNLGNKNSIHLSTWPKSDESLIKEEEIKIVIQINGKVRAEIMTSANDSEEEIKKQALSNDSVLKHIEGKDIKKVIYVKGRLINIVL